MPRQVERALISRFGDRSILLTTKDGRLLCIAPGHQDEVLAYFAKQAHAATDGGRVAIGRPHPGPGGVVQSYEEALNALDSPSASTSTTPSCAPPTCWSTPSSPATAKPWPTSSPALWDRSPRPRRRAAAP